MDIIVIPHPPTGDAMIRLQKALQIVRMKIESFYI